MILAAAIVFVLCVGALAHSYVVYPLTWKLWRGPDSPPAPEPALWPTITVIVAAYNEEAVIADRVRNLLALDYPADRWNALIASDGSADETIVRARDVAGSDPRIHLHDFTPRRGKVSVLNDACARATGELLVFTDANVAFHPDALRELARGFTAPDIGAVCGKLVFLAPGQAGHTVSEGVYWRFETWLKQQEGARGVLLGANGAIYALRRELWQPCPPDTLVDDFFIPARILLGGRRVTFTPRALAEEELPPHAQDEFGRRIRIGAGNFQALTRCGGLLNPRRPLVAWAFFSHKFLRWLGAFLSAFALGLAGVSAGWILLAAQGAFYGLAALAPRMPAALGPLARLAALARHFVSMNAALGAGFVRWLLRTQRVTWHRTAR